MKKKVTTGFCKHCNQPITLIKGTWVHNDPDEDKKAFDYGWLKCAGSWQTAELKKGI